MQTQSNYRPIQDTCEKAKLVLLFLLQTLGDFYLRFNEYMIIQRKFGFLCFRLMIHLIR